MSWKTVFHSCKAIMQRNQKIKKTKTFVLWILQWTLGLLDGHVSPQCFEKSLSKCLFISSVECTIIHYHYCIIILITDVSMSSAKILRESQNTLFLKQRIQANFVGKIIYSARASFCWILLYWDWTVLIITYIWNEDMDDIVKWQWSFFIVKSFLFP